jgi:ketosteroid isomerase-like protein
MRGRTILTGSATAAAGLALMAGLAIAQQPADVEAVKAANAAFYAALSARDAKAMDILWANKPYVVNIGPRAKAAAVGYAEAVTKWSASLPDVFAELKVSMTSTIQVQTNGKVAWVVGTENAVGKNKAGEPFAFDTFVTNVFEKEGDRWLMVSHHAGIVPK